MGLINLALRAGGAAVKKPGLTWSAIDNIGSLATLGYLGAQVPGMSGRTDREAAKDFDIKDIEGAYDKLGWHQKLPFIGATKKGLEAQIRKQETAEFKDSDIYKVAVQQLDADQIPDISGLDKTMAAGRLGQAVRSATTQRDDDKWGKEFRRAQQASTAEYMLPHNVEARRLLQEQRNDTLLREAQIRADATNARQENNLMTLQLAEMNDRADYRREKAGARQALVAALVGSLDNLGNAFVSI